MADSGNANSVDQETTVQLDSDLVKRTPKSSELEFRILGAAADDRSLDTEDQWRLILKITNRDGDLDHVRVAIVGDVILGRGTDAVSFLDLTPYGAQEAGVSGSHLRLRPDGNRLFAFDLDSTNGTRLNGRSIGANIPNAIHNDDTLELGNLSVQVSVVNAPRQTKAKDSELSVYAEALTRLSKAITSHLELSEILPQILQMAVGLTVADESSVWLVDQTTQELFLEAEYGMSDDKIKRMRLPVSGDSIVGRVISSGEPVRVNQPVSGDRIKIKTGYMVEAVIYVPLRRSGATFGVLGATHRISGQMFSLMDETLLQAIADFAAIAINNALKYEAAHQALLRRAKELSALNDLITSVATELDPDRVLRNLSQQVRDQWPELRVEVWRASNGKDLFLFDTREIDSSTEKISAWDKRTLTDLATNIFDAKEPVWIKGNDVKELSTLPPSAPQSYVPGSLACVPFATQDDQFSGIVGVFGNQEDDVPPDVLELLKAFVAHTSTAMHNAYLYNRLQREQVTIRTLLETYADPLIIMDDQFHIVAANKAFGALWSDMVAHKVVENGEPIERGKIFAKLIGKLDQSDGESTEIEVGKKIYAVRTSEQSNLGLLILLEDVSHAHHLDYLRKEFSKAFTHELKGPLSLIVGYADLMSDLDSIPAEAVSMSESILTAAKRATVMTEQLLDFALLSSAKERVTSLLNISELILEAKLFVDPPFEERKINVDMTTNGKLYEIRGDKTRLHRSLTYLLSHAARYAPEKSTVTVVTSYLKDEIVIEVEDRGPRFTEEYLNGLFTTYNWVAQSTGERQGLGLRMILAHSTITAHRGSIIVENLPKGGVKFTLRLPRSAGDSRANT